MKHLLILISILLLQGCIKKQSPPKVVQSPKYEMKLSMYERITQCVVNTIIRNKLNNLKMLKVEDKIFEMVNEECERSLGKVDYKGKEKKKVLYMGKRNGKVGWFEVKWEGEKNNNNKDVGKYVGEIKNGSPNGQGTINLTFDKYVGEFKNGYYDGKGTLISRYGGIWNRKYIGEFKWGGKNGYGIIIYPDGNRSEGEWKYSERWNGLDYDKDGNITGRCVKGILYDKDGNIIQ